MPSLQDRAGRFGRQSAFDRPAVLRQLVTEKLPRAGKGVDRLRRRRKDPLFRLLDRLPLVSGDTATDVTARHDDYLYGETPKPARAWMRCL